MKYEISYLIGVATLPKLEWRIVKRMANRRWWSFRYREEWYIETQFASLGPFDSLAEANKMLAIAKGT